MQINKPFYKLMLSIFLNMASLTQSTENNKFAKSLQYLKTEIRDSTDKHRGIQKVGTNHTWWVQPGMPKVLKIFAMSQEGSGDETDF